MFVTIGDIDLTDVPLLFFVCWCCCCSYYYLLFLIVQLWVIMACILIVITITIVLVVILASNKDSDFAGDTDNLGMHMPLPSWFLPAHFALWQLERGMGWRLRKRGPGEPTTHGGRGSSSP